MRLGDADLRVRAVWGTLAGRLRGRVMARKTAKERMQAAWQPYMGRLVLWGRRGGIWHIVAQYRDWPHGHWHALVCGRTDTWVFNLRLDTLYGMSDLRDSTAPHRHLRICRACKAALEAAGEDGVLPHSGWEQ